MPDAPSHILPECWYHMEFNHQSRSSSSTWMPKPLSRGFSHRNPHRSWRRKLQLLLNEFYPILCSCSPRSWLICLLRGSYLLQSGAAPLPTHTPLYHLQRFPHQLQDALQATPKHLGTKGFLISLSLKTPSSPSGIASHKNMASWFSLDSSPP